MDPIISNKRSLIVDCQFNSLEKFREVLLSTGDLSGVGGYKIGPALTGRAGYDRAINMARNLTSNKALIWDGQKWGTDTPHTAKDNLGSVRDAGFDAVILFPLAGPKTEEVWIKAARNCGLGVIVGGEMTHEKYLRSEGGYIADEAIFEMYLNAAVLGVRDFVVPGNKPNSIREIKKVLEMSIEGDFNLYSPGFVTQNGDLTESAEVAGDKFHAIVGRGIYNALDMRQASMNLISKL